VDVSGVSIDSRTLRPGELFFALRGEHVDGHRFVQQALEKGAVGAVVRADWITPSRGREAQGLLMGVEDPLAAMGTLASWYRSRFSLPMVGITGTNGKTTTKVMAAAAVSRRLPVLSSQKSFNNAIGVPLTLFELSSRHRAGILELGMNAPGEIAHLCRIAQPTLGVITNIGPGHLERFGSIEGVAAAKGELLAYLGKKAVAILNADDPLVMGVARGFSGMVVGFGIENPCAFRAEEVRLDERGRPRFRVHGHRIQLKVMGLHNLYNALAALAIGSVLDVSVEEAKVALERFETVTMRGETILWKGIHIINDCYNANPSSMRRSLDLLDNIKGGNKIAVLGDMLELGSMSGWAHREIGRYAAKRGVRYLLCVGPLSSGFCAGAVAAGLKGERAMHFEDKETLAKKLEELLRPEDVVLVKGSRRMKMEEVLDLLGIECRA